MTATSANQLTPKQRAALRYVHASGPTGPDALATGAGVGAQTLSALVVRGLLDPRTAGGRGTLYHLTDDGRRVVSDHVEAELRDVETTETDGFAAFVSDRRAREAAAPPVKWRRFARGDRGWSGLGPDGARVYVDDPPPDDPRAFPYGTVVDGNRVRAGVAPSASDAKLAAASLLNHLPTKENPVTDTTPDTPAASAEEDLADLRTIYDDVLEAVRKIPGVQLTPKPQYTRVGFGPRRTIVYVHPPKTRRTGVRLHVQKNGGEDRLHVTNRRELKTALRAIDQRAAAVAAAE